MSEPSGLTRSTHFTFEAPNWRARSRSPPFTLSYIDLLRPAQATPCEIYVTSVYAGPPARFRISAGNLYGPTWIKKNSLLIVSFTSRVDEVFYTNQHTHLTVQHNSRLMDQAFTMMHLTPTLTTSE